MGGVFGEVLFLKDSGVRPLFRLSDGEGDTASVPDVLDAPETVRFPWRDGVDFRKTANLYLSTTPRAKRLVPFVPFRSSSTSGSTKSQSSSSRSVSSSMPFLICLSRASMPDFSLRLPACFDDRGTVGDLGGMGGFPDFEEVSLLWESALGRGTSAEGRFVGAEGSIVSVGCVGSVRGPASSVANTAGSITGQASGVLGSASRSLSVSISAA